MSNPLALPPRSLGLKLIVILILTVIMAIPVVFISAVSFERSNRADEVTRDVSQTYGGAQRLMGPIITVPYRERVSDTEVREGDYVISALSGEAVFHDLTVEKKSRSLYTVPVYSLEGTLSGSFAALEEALPQNEGLIFDLSGARVIVGLSDVTGLQADVTMRAGGDMLTFEPYTGSHRFSGSLMNDPLEGSVLSGLNRHVSRDLFNGGPLTLLSAPIGDRFLTEEANVSVSIDLTGAQSLSVLPYARSTTLSISSDWPHPGFSGRFPPSEREITDEGFTADWSVPFLRRGIPAQGRALTMSGLTDAGGQMQVNFVSPLNPYQTVNRALKYAVLFIGLVFLAYFLMETLLGTRVHPAQYLLIGLAQAVFYLLLLAFSEHIGFTPAFLISAAATVILTATYAGAVFGRTLIWKSAFVFGAVYGLLFVLMRIQDFALMVGALISFLAIAATLYLTRNLDWYGGRNGEILSGGATN